MVVHCGCCECSKRVAVLIIAGISVVHFLVESVAVVAVGGDHSNLLSLATPYFYTMLGAQIFMLIVSVLLGIGAYSNIFWLCIPWIVTTLMNLVYHVYILLVLIVKMFENYNVIKMEMLIFITFSCVVLLYMDGVVGSFVRDLMKNGKSNTIMPTNSANRYNEEEQRPLIKGYN